MSVLAPERTRRDRLRVRLLRVGDVGDRVALGRLADLDPIVNVVVAARLMGLRALSGSTFGGPVLGAWDGAGRLVGAAVHGGNLMPVGGDSVVWRALADRLRADRRACSSIVGPVEAVDALWRGLRPSWGRPRAVRRRQLLLRLDTAAGLGRGDDRVRIVGSAEIGAYLPAAAAMFTEELDVSPTAHGAGPGYRRRISALLRQGRALALVADDGAVLFKADIGAVSAATCQLQGVWVRPDLRGRGLATAALVPVLRHALTLAPSVSLYVNDFNEPARRLYERLGMRHEADLATVLF